MRRSLLASALLAAAAAGPAWGQTKTGTTIGQFLLIEPCARAAGMGNAGVAAYDGLQGAYYNPAAIGRVSRREVQFSHAQWLAGISYDYVAVALPLGRWGSAYATTTALNSGDMDVRTVEQPLGTGERYSVSDIAIGLGYGYAITTRFSAGIHVGYVQETIWHSSASTLVVSGGTVYRVSPNGLHIGSSISNMGTSAAFSGRDLRILYDNDPTRYGDNGTLPGERYTEDYPVPVLFRVGLGMPYRLSEASRLWVELDAFHPNDNTESISSGAELTLRDALALRIGYQNLFQQDSEVGLTMGAGLKGTLEGLDYRLDYAWADYGRLESTHRVTLGLLF
jgi:hypothetical protein